MLETNDNGVTQPGCHFIRITERKPRCRFHSFQYWSNVSMAFSRAPSSILRSYQVIAGSSGAGLVASLGQAPAPDASCPAAGRQLRRSPPHDLRPAYATIAFMAPKAVSIFPALSQERFEIQRGCRIQCRSISVPGCAWC